MATLESVIVEDVNKEADKPIDREKVTYCGFFAETETVLKIL